MYQPKANERICHLLGFHIKRKSKKDIIFSYIVSLSFTLSSLKNKNYTPKTIDDALTLLVVTTVEQNLAMATCE